MKFEKTHTPLRAHSVIPFYRDSSESKGVLYPYVDSLEILVFAGDGKRHRCVGNIELFEQIYMSFSSREHTGSENAERFVYESLWLCPKCESHPC